MTNNWYNDLDDTIDLTEYRLSICDCIYCPCTVFLTSESVCEQCAKGDCASWETGERNSKSSQMHLNLNLPAVTGEEYMD